MKSDGNIPHLVAIYINYVRNHLFFSPIWNVTPLSCSPSPEAGGFKAYTNPVQKISLTYRETRTASKKFDGAFPKKSALLLQRTSRVGASPSTLEEERAGTENWLRKWKKSVSGTTLTSTIVCRK